MPDATTRIQQASATADPGLIKALVNEGLLSGQAAFGMALFIVLDAADGEDQRVLSAFQALAPAGVDFGGFDDDLGLLHPAARAGLEETVRFLLDQGAGVDAPEESASRFFDTPLIQAIERGHTRVAQLLLERGAAVNGLDGQVNPPLFAGVDTLNPIIVQELLGRGARVDCHNAAGHSILHALTSAAVSQPDSAHVATLAMALVEAGADPQALHSEDISAMDYARAMHPRLAQVLLDFQQAKVQQQQLQAATVQAATIIQRRPGL